jgi:beta-glucosidase
LKLGEAKKVELELPLKYAGSYWDEERDMWALEKGTYGLLVGDLKGEFQVETSKWWKGL